MLDIINRIRNILLFPAQTWETIRGEKSSVLELFAYNAFLLIFIPVVFKVIGRSVVGVQIGLDKYYLPMNDAIFAGLMHYIFTVLGLFMTGIVINYIAFYFKLNSSLETAIKLVVYSSIPVWLAGIFLALPSISILFALGLYGLHLFYLGAPILFKVPPEKNLWFFLSTMPSLILLGFFILVLGNRYFYLPSIQGMIIFQSRSMHDYF